MATAAPIRQQVQVCIGKAGLPLGSLVYVQQGRRENCAFAYDEAWLANPGRFNVSADLQLMPGHQPHKAASPHDSVFHGAIADTSPDAWGRRVIARDHAKRRRTDPKLAALTESAASLLQASREEDRSYTEIADAIRSHGHEPARDLRQLWRRLVFNLLITNVDDHLQNHGFLHVAHGLWRLAPAFDVNPFPEWRFPCPRCRIAGRSDPHRRAP